MIDESAALNVWNQLKWANEDYHVHLANFLQTCVEEINRLEKRIEEVEQLKEKENG